MRDPPDRAMSKRVASLATVAVGHNARLRGRTYRRSRDIHLGVTINDRLIPFIELKRPE